MTTEIITLDRNAEYYVRKKCYKNTITTTYYYRSNKSTNIHTYERSKQENN